MAAVVRSQFVETVCHTCFRELPKLAPLAGAKPQKESEQPYKQYCSRACALGDKLAGVTMSIHAKVDELATKTQVHVQPALHAVFVICHILDIVSQLL